VIAKPPPLPGARRSRLRIDRPLLVVLTVLAVVFGGLLVWHISFRIRTNNTIKRLEAKARANGEPVTITELIASYPPIPDEENAAIPLMALWEKEDPGFWAAYRANRRPLPSTSPISPPEGLPVMTTGWNHASAAHPLDADTLAVAEKFLMDRSEHAALLHDAFKRRKARFPVRFDEGLMMPLPHLARMKFEAQFLRIESLVLMAKGDTNGAVEAVVDGFALAELLKEEPLIISQLFRVACQGIAVRGVEDLLNQATLSPAQIAVLETTSRRSADPRLVRKALLGERVLSADLFSSLPKLMALMDQPDSDGAQDTSSTGNTIMMKLWQMSGLAQTDHACLLAIFDRAITAAALDLPEGLKGYEAAFAGLDTGRRPTPSTLVSRMLLPALSKSLARQATADARRLCAETALAIERFRLSNGGGLPDTLEALTPTFLAETPKDPFDGKPLRYLRKKTGYLVYSIAADRVDDHGMTLEDAKKSAARLRLAGKVEPSGKLQFDETFTVER
jgi:hypothetical protein